MAHKLKVDELAIYHGERGRRQVARWMAKRLCQTVGGMSLSQIADAFHVSHISGISHQISRLRQLLQTDPETDTDFQLLIQYLDPLRPLVVKKNKTLYPIQITIFSADTAMS